MKNIFTLILTASLFFSCGSQEKMIEKKEETIQEKSDSKPKLIVGIVVDQMRYDYLTRFEAKFGEGGFKRMIREGFNCKNNHFNYIPTKTAAGHASIYTGTTPRYHGIIGNSWFDKTINESVYCVRDNSYESVGTASTDGQMSPHRMTTTTFSDENRLFTQMQGKTIGISIKDRGAVLPAGHSANAAYWFRGKDEGAWISSTFYMNALPKWVNDFNASNISSDYLKEWNTLYPIETYTESGNDLNNFEDGFKSKTTATFPYDLKVLSKDNGGYDILKSTPYGNSLTTDFAIAAIEGEQLGKDNHTDVLTVSFSSTDYVGHNFGVNAKETHDTYLRLDKDLERFFNYLDSYVGEGEYTVFLTADHGAPYVPAFLNSHRIPGGLLDFNTLKADLNELLLSKFNTNDLVLKISNEQVFLNHEAITSNNIELADVENTIINKLLDYEMVNKAFKGGIVNNSAFQDGVELLLKNGYNQKRSGDIVIVMESSVFSDGPWNKKGTDHGSGYVYDTHVPLLFFGAGIKQGETYKKTVITDIAPTISALLGISFPNGTTGNVLGFIID
ncbi:alkaline phosphatase PafA [Winogradskyella sp.]|jgi:predicted AlkP superfamily pyrophosphatase or phosphodiesterase|uniref:alkaline phosphatase PafA n=1 Tax=Winogradskyella sp. TaxID=1883156 RepID=UPI0025FAD5A6|nr:alkaline phosphatase PafA [Winogradskyella sp.]MCT4629834.1 alkaline phosphatase family protein [Winogradskyella sp.]